MKKKWVDERRRSVQGCPLSATLFGLFVDGLEQHLMDTVGHDAPVGTLPLRRTDFTATIC